MTSSAHAADTGNRGYLTTLQKAARAVGAVFLLVGILGFIPGITQNMGDMTFAGYQSDAFLLGIFEVSVLHNLVHLLFGVAGLVMSRTWSGARNYLIGGGAIYLVLFIYGLLVPLESSANFVPVNTADDILHLLLGVAMLGLGLALSRRDRAVTTGNRAV